jgi:putative ABC transport system substrate-binding protein
LIAAGLAVAARRSLAQVPQKVFQIGLMANSIPAADLASRKTTNPAPKIIEDGLRDLGWVDGKNIRLVWKTVEGRYERWPEVLEELVRMRVDVIVVFADPPAKIAVEKTRTIPIVHVGMGTLLEPRLINSLQRPGGNLTGMSIDGLNLGAKRLELLKAAVPSLSRAAILVHYTPAVGVAPAISPETEAVGHGLGVSLFFSTFERLEELPRAFSDLVAKGANGILVGESPHLYYREYQLPIHELAVKHRIPAMWRILNAPDSGGLMAYAPNILDFYRGAPRYIDKILRGAKPGDIPIEMPSKFDFVINMKTARAMGITIPSFVLSLADRVIQ